MVKKEQNENDKIKEVLLRVFEQFRRICDEEGLRYFAIGGTCIGAVRHQGFIPWDDDIDVAMPISDLVRFVEVATQKLDKRYEIYTPFDHKHFFRPFIKLIDSETTFIEKLNVSYPDTYKGIGIDIMPMYGMPCEREKQKEMAIHNNTLIRINTRIRLSLQMFLSLVPGVKSIVSWTICSPMRLVTDYNWAIRKSLRLYSNISFDNSDKVLFAWRKYNTNESKPYKSVFDFKDFSDSLEVDFENSKMRIPVGYDNYLRHDLGDYMKLPPESKRVSNHDVFVVDTDRSYRDYIGKI